MTTPTCLYPHGGLFTGQFCRSRGVAVVINNQRHTLCPFHIRAVRREQAS